MFFHGVVAALAALSVPVHSLALKNRAPGLDVQLNSVKDTVVEALVTNKADHDVSLLNLNSFFDTAPVKKVSVSRAGAPVLFEGISLRYLMRDFAEDAFTRLASGESVRTTFDIAEIYDLTKGGEYIVSSEGSMPFAEAGQTVLKGSMPYKSNQLKLDVDGLLASTVTKAVQRLTNNKRTVVADDCSGENGSALTTGLENSAQLASAASEAALNNEALFEEYFGTADAARRESVAQRFQKVADESSSTTEGVTSYYCNDPYALCEDGVLAYTLPAYDEISNCPLFYSALPPLADSCQSQDQATTVLHEFTHAPGLLDPSTVDHAYGYEASTALSAEQAFLNADNYALFSLAVSLDC